MRIEDARSEFWVLTCYYLLMDWTLYELRSSLSIRFLFVLLQSPICVQSPQAQGHNNIGDDLNRFLPHPSRFAVSRVYFNNPLIYTIFSSLPKTWSLLIHFPLLLFSNLSRPLNHHLPSHARGSEP